MNCDENPTWENQLLLFDSAILTFVKARISLRTGL